MAIPVPFGQFVPGDSFVHRLDARAKLLAGVGFAVLVFASSGWPALAVGAAVALAALVVSRVPWRLAARGLSAVALLLAFTLLANALRWRPEEALLRIGPLAVDGPGLARGTFFSARIVLLVLGTTLVTLTTSPVALTDALARLMRPLARVRVPVDDIAMMLSIALRFIPTTAEEAEKIVVAQTTRGARFDTGGPLRRAKAWTPVLIPLFVRLFRRADDLAIAMESRCYRGEGRTRLHESRMATADWVVLVVAVTLAVAGVAWM